MMLHIFDPDFVVPFLIFTIPIIAIIGGIVTGIVRTMGRQRLLELAQQERIAAIQRGVDPAKLPPFSPALFDDSSPFSPHDSERRRYHGLLVGGVVTTCAGVGVAIFLAALKPDENRFLWSVGIVPIAVGIGLLLSAWITRPRSGPEPPRS
jgi:hypothetical protein